MKQSNHDHEKTAEKKSTNQLEAIRNTRNKELATVINLSPGFTCQGKLGRFIDLYIQSEVFARKLQHYYRIETGSSGKDELNVQVLNAAISHFKLTAQKKDIGLLLIGGPGKRGSKSARQLSDGYLHALSQEDKKCN